MTTALASALAARIGESWGPSGWQAVDQPMIDAFAALSGDRQWIHVDPERARRESPFGGTVAHGLLVLALVPALVAPAPWLHARAGVNLGSNRLRFISPVRAGARIRALAELAGVAEQGGGVRITTLVTVELEGSAKPACSVELIGLLYD